MDINSEPIPAVWRMKHWLSGDVREIVNDGTLPKLLEKFAAVRDGYEIDDNEMSEATNGQ